MIAEASELSSWVWGPRPRGFRRVVWNLRQLMLVEEGLDAHQVLSIIQRSSVDNLEREPFYGRSLLPRLRLENGEDVVIRPYFHGGSLNRFTRDMFFTWPPRPFRELVVTTRVRERAIPTLDVLAAGIEMSWGPFTVDGCSPANL